MGARELCVAYGLSEASPNVVLNDYRDPVELRIAGLAKPHDGVEVRIADPQTQASLPAGASGEIQVRGWNVMRGYYKNPEETAKAFTADGWLRTGDLGVLTEDGRLRMVGRTKDVFRVGGENVAPAEVEEVLLAHPAVATAQVVGVPDPRLGEVGAAFVTLKADARATEAELAEFVQAALRQFPRAALRGDRRELRRHRHDGERQGAEEQAARARDRAVQARRSACQGGSGLMSDVILCECFARDGLQHEADFVATDTKRRLIERFADLGFQRVEATSYSNPKVVPQFADASELLQSLRAARRRPLQGDLRQCARGRARARRSRCRLRRERDQPAGLGERSALDEEPAAIARRPVGERAQDGGGRAGPLPAGRHHLGGVRMPVRGRRRSRRRGGRRRPLPRLRRRSCGARRHHRHGDAREHQGRCSAVCAARFPASN